MALPDQQTQPRPTMGGTETVTLWRATGSEELDAIRATGWQLWPQQPAEQEMFCPTLSRDYALHLAADWTALRKGGGHVLQFCVAKSFLDGYPVHTVRRTYSEYWIPVSELDQFNANVVGSIELIRSFTAN